MSFVHVLRSCSSAQSFGSVLRVHLSFRNIVIVIVVVLRPSSFVLRPSSFVLRPSFPTFRLVSVQIFLLPMFPRSSSSYDIQDVDTDDLTVHICVIALNLVLYEPPD
jgi:hypothetical protein